LRPGPGDPEPSVRYGNCMKLSLDAPAATNLIRSYGPAGVQVGERTLTRSTIVSPSRLIEDWRPRSIDELLQADLAPLLEWRPGVVLIGTGARQRFPAQDLLAALYASRLGFEFMDTGAACRTYNVLVAEGRDVAAALIVESH
jgi:uncharacterized protein